MLILMGRRSVSLRPKSYASRWGLKQVKPSRTGCGGETRRGVNYHPMKNSYVTETATTFTSTDLVENSSRPTGRMTTAGQSLPRDARSVSESFLRPKAKGQFSAWDVRTMCEASKMAQVGKP